MSQTLYNKWEKPLSREQNLELFLQTKLDEVDAALGNAHIEGLLLGWNSNNSIVVGSGMAWVSGFGRMRVASALTVSGISLGANAWGHVYLYSNAGVPSVEVVTTAPAVYFGTAYRKTGDATRRYLGSVRTDASGNIFNFQHGPANFVRYLCNIFTSPHQVLVAGAAATETTVSAAAVVPVTSKMLRAVIENTATTPYGLFGNSEDSVALPPGLSASRPASVAEFDLPLNSSQAFTYAMSSAPASGGLYVNVAGYTFQR